jgi:hypothetical protein
MKKAVCLLVFIYLFIYSCKAQNRIDIKKEDIFIFAFKNDNVILGQRVVYSKNNFIIFSKKWGSEDMGYGNFKKHFKFIQHRDTMDLEFSSQYNNLYFKNFIFKKGYYKLDYLPNNYQKRKNMLSTHSRGSRIETPKEVQHMLFKNAFIDATANPETTFKDTYFKDLKFIEIDISDTINVKFKKAEKEVFSIKD